MAESTKLREEVLSLMSETRTWVSQRQITKISKDSFVESMKSKYDYLYNKSSTLFDRCIEGDLNMEQFNYMLNMLDKVNSGKDYQDVSKEIGQKLVDIYVKPLLKE